MPDPPDTRFAKVGDVHIAYQVVGDGPIDILFVDTWVHHVEAVWDFPEFARLLRRLASFGRLIHFDRRGTGLSDPVPLDALPDFDTQVEDVIAVLDAAGSERPAIVGSNDGTLVAMLLAVAHPERCRSLVLFAPTGKHELEEGASMESIEDVVTLISTSVDDSGLHWLAPSRVGDVDFDRRLLKLQRNSVRQGAMGHYYRQTLLSDVRDVIPRLARPTLVLNRSGNRVVPMEHSKDVAAGIDGAKLVELPGEDHLIFSQDIDRVADEIEEFLTGARTGADPDRMLATLLFTDIVDSTNRAAEWGDRRWRDLLDQHHAVIRTQLGRFGGREVATTGDGFFASFASPTQAVRCALEVAQTIETLGVRIRAGVHTGEVEVRGDDLGGLAVHIAARVSAAAGAGEVMVSSTVRDLLAGAAVTFDDRGEHELKGVPGAWRLFAARETYQ
ncbi:MAG TPA: adenylate/guanylate cyclase domain-containing protein [Actinomycetota bacterium]|nr:adenylate/guanylate cyclase domain-containing protein [Actinomycetota bacterium]